MKRIPAILTGLMVLVLLVAACGSAAPTTAPTEPLPAPTVSASGGEATPTDIPEPAPQSTATDPVTDTDAPVLEPTSTVATIAPTDTPFPPTDTVDQPAANESGEAQATLLYFWASW